MAKYRKRPVIIEAFQWTGGPDQLEDPVWICEAIKRGDVRFGANPLIMYISTPEGVLTAQLMDWIIQGTAGEIYPCKPKIFAAIYEPE